MRLCLNMLIFTHNLGNWLITLCNENNTNQITDIRTLQFTFKLRSLIHVISLQSNAASHYPVLVPARNANGYLATAGSDGILKI